MKVNPNIPLILGALLVFLGVGGDLYILPIAGLILISVGMWIKLPKISDPNDTVAKTKLANRNLNKFYILLAIEWGIGLLFFLPKDIYQYVYVFSLGGILLFIPLFIGVFLGIVYLVETIKNFKILSKKDVNLFYFLLAH